MAKKLRIGIIGLSFGKFFIPVYQRHPDVAEVCVCARTRETLEAIKTQFALPEENLFGDWRVMLREGNLDAVHIVTPMSSHFPMTMAALEAGLHCACTVPMADTVEECAQIVAAVNKSGKTYMMMETALYTRDYLEAKVKAARGEFGRIQLLRGVHMQNMGLFKWPAYWEGYPPMWYATHAVAPLFDLIGKRPESVACFGSGRISPELSAKYGSPFAAETAMFAMKGSDILCEATRSLYELQRQYRESFEIYGDKLTFEWEQVAGEGGVYFVDEEAKRAAAPDHTEGLPEELIPFTTAVKDMDKTNNSFLQGSGHGGSYPHMVHEFVSAILGNRKAYVDEIYAAELTAAGLCAHESAMRGGERVFLPSFA